ncbi:MAG: hypothetical protein K8L97_15010 [Anaerolineae bacterium]|nr:hypothetical protein [Anaerolineae bacterium]
MTKPAQQKNTRFEYALKLNVEGVRQSLQHMPESSYKSYCIWVLNTPQFAGQWLQLMGIESLIRLTGGLLDDLLNNDEWLKLVPYSVPINVSQMYEVVSDNLAIGLGHRSPNDATFNTRSQLVYTFNQATIQRLKGDSRQSARELLDPFIPLMRKISTFEQSLSADKHLALAHQFLNKRPSNTLNTEYVSHFDTPPGHWIGVEGHPMQDLEYALHPLLVANMETCIDLTAVLQDSLSHPLLVDGLIRRYQGVNDLLDQQTFSMDDLLRISTNTIMVVPTLAYYIGVIVEKVHPIPTYHQVLEDGSLLRVLEDAALLVRLLNDMGTLLLEQSSNDRLGFIQSLHALNQSQSFSSFEQLMLEATGRQGVLLTRLRKDVKFGEFNVGLHSVRQIENVSEAIEVFAEQLNLITNVYRERMHRLHEGVEDLNRRLDSNLAGDLSMRFVQFHRHTYSHSFESAHGEYAV